MSLYKIAGAVFSFIILAIITILFFKNFPIDVPSAAQELASYEITAKRDLLALMMAYPEHITGLEKENDHTIYIIMQSGKNYLRRWKNKEFCNEACQCRFTGYDGESVSFKKALDIC